jgi:hypothetical protein
MTDRGQRPRRPYDDRQSQPGPIGLGDDDQPTVVGPVGGGEAIPVGAHRQPGYLADGAQDGALAAEIGLDLAHRQLPRCHIARRP